jgi:hypothetical protein
MAQFLSAEWLSELDAELDAAAGRGAVGSFLPERGRLVVQQVVRGAPGGEVAYHLRLEGGRARILAGRAGDADVTLIQDVEVARAIARSERSAQAAFMAGQLSLEGDVKALVAHQAALAALDEVLAPVRTRTTY